MIKWGVALGTDYAQQECCLARTLEVVGERWSLLIVRDAFFGVRRFSDFRIHLDIPRAVLASRLQALAAAGVLEKVPDEPTRGRPRQCYVLTARGRELWLPVYLMSEWGARHASDGHHIIFSHAACEDRLGQFGQCPACGMSPVPPGQVMMAMAPGARQRKDPVSKALARPHLLLTPVTVDAPVADDEENPVAVTGQVLAAGRPRLPPGRVIHGRRAPGLALRRPGPLARCGRHGPRRPVLRRTLPRRPGTAALTR
jgi:DNA-binding HxlR family transcriptional regulator